MTTPLSEQSRVLINEQEPDIRANRSEATRLYQRGVAAARGGQRRIAVGLLTRSVKLDPRNEGAWLWLSGVLDDPHQIAFCLNAVIKLNPTNARALKGLRWLDEQKLLKGQATPAPLMDIDLDEPESQPEERGEPWWVSWRQGWRDSHRVKLLWWAFPIVVLSLALAINQSFVLAVGRSSEPPVIPTPVRSAGPPNMQVPAMMSEPPLESAPILDENLDPIRQSQAIEYLHELGMLRQELRSAVDTYRNVTGRPGGSLSHIAATQNLRATVQEAYQKIQGMEPPADLRQGHLEYLKGLEVELAAIDDLLEFYSSYQVQLANRAALRFQEANTHFDNARVLFGERMQQIEHSNPVSPHTLR